MMDRLFRLSENGTTVRTEPLAGVTTFLTMAYIIFVQPAMLSGRMFGMDTGMDFGSVTAATRLTARAASSPIPGAARAISSAPACARRRTEPKRSSSRRLRFGPTPGTSSRTDSRIRRPRR